MPRAADREVTPDADASQPVTASTPVRGGGATVSLADLPVAGLTRRRIAILLGALVAAWAILLFAQQVGEASVASAKAEEMRASNTELQANVDALQNELTLINRQAFMEQQARSYRLGTPREIPFALTDNAPSLPPDAPGSAGVRLGAAAQQPSPLGQWIKLLFGPGGDPSNPAGSAGG